MNVEPDERLTELKRAREHRSNTRSDRARTIKKLAVVIGAPLLVLAAFLIAPCGTVRAEIIIEWAKKPEKMLSLVPSCKKLGPDECRCTWRPSTPCASLYGMSSGGKVSRYDEVSDCGGMDF